ncbi:MAG: DUF805 domain-containing protein [Methylococcales bacterium]|nr:DUF805 domain-containing protein [Methylococcales bacterium]
MNWYFGVLKKYTVFSGRAQRAEYWYFVLFNMLVGVGLSMIDQATGTLDAETGVGLLGGLYSLAVLLPSLGVSVRRLHDTDRSGWWMFILLIPVIGVIALLVFFVQDSTAGTNEYGDNPKGVMK